MCNDNECLHFLVPPPPFPPLCHTQSDEAEAKERELALLTKAIEEAKASVEEERQAAAAAEATRAEEAKRAAAETEALRQQLDNAVRRVAASAIGGISP